MGVDIMNGWSRTKAGKKWVFTYNWMRKTYTITNENMGKGKESDIRHEITLLDPLLKLIEVKVNSWCSEVKEKHNRNKYSYTMAKKNNKYEHNNEKG